MKTIITLLSVCVLMIFAMPLASAGGGGQQIQFVQANNGYGGGFAQQQFVQQNVHQQQFVQQNVGHHQQVQQVRQVVVQQAPVYQQQFQRVQQVQVRQVPQFQRVQQVQVRQVRVQNSCAANIGIQNVPRRQFSLQTNGRRRSRSVNSVRF